MTGLRLVLWRFSPLMQEFFKARMDVYENSIEIAVYI
jgi:hypothetical protein